MRRRVALALFRLARRLYVADEPEFGPMFTFTTEGGRRIAEYVAESRAFLDAIPLG